MSKTKSNSLKFLVLCLVLLHAFLFLGFWLTNSLFYNVTNEFLVDMTGVKLDYISLCLVIAGLLVLWSAFQWLAIRSAKPWRFQKLTSFLYWFAGFLFLAFFYGSFSMLFGEAPVQFPRLAQYFHYHRIIFDSLFVFILAVYIGIALSRRKLSPQNSVSHILLYLVIVSMIVGFVTPWFYFPGSVYINLPEKPRIIAHRGASMLAPENTLAAMQLALDLGVFGLETDIFVSQDDELFLMHDETLERTTNVADIFPRREKQRAETFSSSELIQLDAGSWFVRQDPYKSISTGAVDKETIQSFRNQKVPKFTELLEIVRKSGIILIFDLKPPPTGNTYPISLFDRCLEQLISAGIDDQVWFLVDESQLSTLQKKATKMHPAAGVDFQNPAHPDELKQAGYEIVNFEYGMPIENTRAYKKAGLLVNIYTVDEPWQYSRLWVQGVDSITTNNLIGLINLSKPVLGMSKVQYNWVWGIETLVCALIVWGLWKRL